MRTPEAHINPELLVWAWRNAGLEPADAAAKLGVTEERPI
jgi:hypothetical protein